MFEFIALALGIVIFIALIGFAIKMFGTKL